MVSWFQESNATGNLESMEQEFSELINYFRKLGETQEAGYARDHSGYGYFDLNKFDDGLAPEICLYYNQYTFRIQKELFVTVEGAKSNIFVVIDILNGPTRRIYASSMDSLKTLIDNTIHHSTMIQVVEEKSFVVENVVITDIEKALKPLIKDNYIVKRSEVKKSFYVIHLQENDMFRIRYADNCFVIDLITDSNIKTIHSNLTNLIHDAKNLLIEYSPGA